jgi:hypothetical protein
MRVRFNSDNYVRRFFASKAITITGIYVRKKFSGNKGSIFGHRLFK